MTFKFQVFGTVDHSELHPDELAYLFIQEGSMEQPNVEHSITWNALEGWWWYAETQQTEEDESPIWINRHFDEYIKMVEEVTVYFKALDYK